MHFYVFVDCSYECVVCSHERTYTVNAYNACRRKKEREFVFFVVNCMSSLYDSRIDDDDE